MNMLEKGKQIWATLLIAAGVIEDLVFYSFDAGSNAYRRISTPAAWNVI